jgi:hypothetical protein
LSQQAQKLGRASDLRSVRWLFAFAEYQTDWKQYKV